MTNANAVIDNQGRGTITFTDTRTGPCNSNNNYVIRNGDTMWKTVGVERQDNIVTITFEGDILSDGDNALTIAAKNGNDESQRSAAVSLQSTQGNFESASPRSRKHVSKF